LVALGLARLRLGAVPVAAEVVAPLYLRPPDAKINWVQRQPVRARS
jgi:hypothetical protein